MTGFTLTERSGKPVQWKDLAGKVTVTSFFFSACPATCLQQNQKVREIQQAFRGHRTCPRQWMGRCGNQDELIIKERLNLELWSAQVGADHAHVQLVLDKPLLDLLRVVDL